MRYAFLFQLEKEGVGDGIFLTSLIYEILSILMVAGY